MAPALFALAWTERRSLSRVFLNLGPIVSPFVRLALRIADDLNGLA
jgi:hypothetical protein